ncbi:MAG: cell division protein FtsB [Gammaproteobacteria bacterium]
MRRWLILILIVLLLGTQYRLWVGRGSLAEVRDLQRAVDAQREENARLAERNATLEAEVSDLKQGLEAVEERARSELGMIKDDEVFYQIVEPEK